MPTIHARTLRDAARAIDAKLNENLGLEIKDPFDSPGDIYASNGYPYLFTDEFIRYSQSTSTDIPYAFPGWEPENSQENDFRREYFATIPSAKDAVYYLAKRLQGTSNGLRSMAKSSETTEQRNAYNVFRYTSGAEDS